MQLAMERALAKRSGTAELVSARELGIGNGTERKTLRVIRPEALTQEQRAEKERLREKGITLTFVEGRIELTGPDDATHYAKGVCVKQKNAIVVRTDAKMPWRKIVRHEEQHAEFDRNPQLLATRWNEFVDHLETEHIERWVAGYAERYGGLYDAADLDALIEEALCDYAADIEAPEVTERYWRETFQKQKETWKQGRNISDAALYRLEQDAGGQKNSAQTGGRASIEEAEKGRYVQADRQVLRGDDPGRWGRQIETYINEKMRDQEDVIFPTEDGHLLALTDRSAYKLTDRHKSQIAKEGRVMLDDASYGVKLRAAAHIDELVQVGQFDRYIEDRRGAHENDIGEDGFNYYTAYFRDFNGEYYRITFSAGVNKNDETVYSIGGIRKRESITRRGSSSGVEAGGAQSRRNRLSSSSSIADREGNVKGKTAVELAFERARERKKAASATDNIGTFNREEEDIRYSADDADAADASGGNAATGERAATREELEEMARELEDERKRSKALESVNRRLREQMKVTPPGTADPASLRQAAKRLSGEYGGALRQKDIAADLQKIWRLRSEGKRGQMMEQVDKLAAELVQHYLDKDNPEAETLREIKQTVRATKIQLTPALRADLDREGGYQDFRRRNFGRIRLANSGLGVDQFYQELSEQWPAYFPEGIQHPADQLLQIADVIQDGTTILQHSPMEAFPDGMTYMRNKVLWELGLVRPAKPTAADKVIRQAADAANRDALIDAAAAHEQEQMDKLDAWYREKLQKVKADREDRIQKVKDRYQERAQAERDWKAEQELKRRLLWHGNRLKRMGRTATPEQQAEIERIFGDINLACQRMTGEVVIKDYIQGMSTEEIRPEGYRDKADPQRTMSAEEGFWHPEVRGDKVVDVERLKAWYEEQKKTNPDFIADRRVEDILANWEKKQINTMSPREVQQLLDVALNVENEIRTQKKLIDAEDRREVYQQVLEVIGDIESTRGRGDRNLPKVIGAVKDGGRWLVDGTLTPVRLLRRFTGYQDSDPLYRAALDLQQGELKQLDYQRRAYARFEGFTKDRKFMDYLAGKGKQKPIEITGMNERGEQVTCRITPDMRVALYLHSKNYQNLRHIQRGGITVPQYEGLRLHCAASAYAGAEGQPGACGQRQLQSQRNTVVNGRPRQV